MNWQNQRVSPVQSLRQDYKTELLVLAKWQCLPNINQSSIGQYGIDLLAIIVVDIRNAVLHDMIIMIF